MNTFLRKNLLLLLTLAVLAGFLAAAGRNMETSDFVITLLRGFSVGALTFLVASGFSLIFGLLDVLNLAHGTLFMIGAYAGWTVYVRPDTFIDLVTPLALLVSGFTLADAWRHLAVRISMTGRGVAAWIGFGVAALLLAYILPRYPIAMWNVDDYAQSPVAYSLAASQGQVTPPPAATFTEIAPGVAVLGLLISSAFIAFGLAWLRSGGQAGRPLTWRSFTRVAMVLLVGLGALIFNDALTAWLFALNSNWLFAIAVAVSVATGVALGGLMEVTLIRPLYVRPIYQLMLTLGLSVIGTELVRAIWGRPEFTMPKPELFAGTGAGCPATTFGDWLTHHCSTVILFEGRVRVYNEIFIPLVGLVVLISIWILLKRSRLGMIIRAGVQDRQMVEALGINVRRVFTQVFALGVGLAALGGVLAAPSIGLSNTMGESFLLNALIALAIGGLTSYPGAALGSLLVGLLQQFIIKYGQIGIPIPFTEILFKPTPPIVPASTVLLMVIVLLIMPNGLLGKKE
ncbi:MAG TPA: branched-chain amino acid ABC transporter permease [Chloroflexi bacterium]|nr:branched-chain amino acid ABC transporter permease [Chloroflexota bacterium]HHW86174.1 branched-chain amino acid ABC transporter permease [Chloroflexota bacterium]